VGRKREEMMHKVLQMQMGGSREEMERPFRMVKSNREKVHAHEKEVKP